jgi:transcriptional regulator with XRE-family HTH domain
MRRRMLRISQTTLGGAIGVSSQKIKRYENGTVTVPASRLQQIANALGCAAGWFFE